MNGKRFKENDVEEMKVLKKFIQLCQDNESQTPFYKVCGYFIEHNNDDNGLTDDFDVDCQCINDLDCSCRGKAACKKHEAIFDKACKSLFYCSNISEKKQEFFEDFNAEAVYDKRLKIIEVKFTRKIDGAFLVFDYRNTNDSRFSYGIGSYRRELEGFTMGLIQNKIVGAFLQYNISFRNQFLRFVIDSGIDDPYLSTDLKAITFCIDEDTIMKVKPSGVTFYGFHMNCDRQKDIIPFTEVELQDLFHYIHDKLEFLKTVHSPEVINAEEAVKISKKRYHDEMAELERQLAIEKNNFNTELERLTKIQKILQK